MNGFIYNMQRTGRSGAADKALACRKMTFLILSLTFGVERDETVTQGPFLHRFLQDHLLRKDDHVNVVKLTKALQDLSHGLGRGLLHHGTYANHNLSLRWLNGGMEKEM